MGQGETQRASDSAFADDCVHYNLVFTLQNVNAVNVIFTHSCNRQPIIYAKFCAICDRLAGIPLAA